jgi:SNF2 family DNA or RNA helicase
MFVKCQYMDEQTKGRGVVFATGTPVSNSMTELYTAMRYLQYDKLKEMGLEHFDSWASTFGETTTSIELAPEGSGYRSRTRFAKFYNLPELMSVFKESADIKTADMLNLPKPDAEFTTIAVEPTAIQKALIRNLAKRAAVVRTGRVDPRVDNMLAITTDGRKIGLDQRLINERLPDAKNSKVNTCAENIFKIWNETKGDRLTQAVFCDFSTPANKRKFNVYHDIKWKLVKKGVPENEIAFIHDCDTEIKKKELFAKVRSGQVRVIFGSTQKMGVGTNIQDKLVALHDLDCPWRPSDLEQRAGRILRQGNKNEKVQIYRYITRGTLDSICQSSSF